MGNAYMNASTEAKTPINSVKWFIAIALAATAVIGNYWFSDLGLLYRVLGVVAVLGTGAGVALTTIQGKAFLQLLREADRERRRVVWPTKDETRQTTLIVMLVVTVMAILLWLVDMALGALIKHFIG
jgi:preprotein translocase subunit SecE